MSDKGPFAVWAAAKQLDAEIGGVSWAGFNLFGDRKSVDELLRLQAVEANFRYLKSLIRDEIMASKNGRPISATLNVLERLSAGP